MGKYDVFVEKKDPNHYAKVSQETILCLNIRGYMEYDFVTKK